jgi:hypothetical protein
MWQRVLIEVAQGPRPHRVRTAARHGGDGRHWAYRIIDGRACWYRDSRANRTSYFGGKLPILRRLRWSPSPRRCLAAQSRNRRRQNRCRPAGSARSGGSAARRGGTLHGAHTFLLGNPGLSSLSRVRSIRPTSCSEEVQGLAASSSCFPLGGATPTAKGRPGA